MALGSHSVRQLRRFESGRFHRGTAASVSCGVNRGEGGSGGCGCGISLTGVSHTEERLASLRSITMIALSRYITPQDCSSFLQAIIPFSPPLPLLGPHTSGSRSCLWSHKEQISSLRSIIVLSRHVNSSNFAPRGPSDSDPPLLSSPLSVFSSAVRGWHDGLSTATLPYHLPGPPIKLAGKSRACIPL